MVLKGSGISFKVSNSRYSKARHLDNPCHTKEDEGENKIDDIDYVVSIENKEIHSKNGCTTNKRKIVIPPNTRKNTFAHVLDESHDKTDTLSSTMPAVRYKEFPVIVEGTSDEIDYDSVPVEEFGFAVIRGLGYKDDEKVSTSSKKFPHECVIRPRGLGLGADKSILKEINDLKRNKKSSVNGELSLRVGAPLRITHGSLNGCYGRITGINEDAARLYVKLTLNNEEVNVSQYCVKLVSEVQFAKYSKYSNKERSEISSDNDNTSCNDASDPVNSSKCENNECLWLMPQLRVRINNKTLCDGKFHNIKAIVLDVVDESCCLCKTDGGEILDRISQSDLETVLPHDMSKPVMIVKGDHRGQLCQIVEYDQRSSSAWVHLDSDKNNNLKLSLSSICEYVF